ncbi:MAG: methyltransferase domain-containing protein [Candidatus Eisenbacteria bacterium]|nr:methyltransferase domain-containing protein [Candidatus Eisenbacteria bacterium]
MGYEERYRETEHVFGEAPEPVVSEFAHMIDRSGAVLDVGAGQGRNALFLAGLGLQVDALEPTLAGSETIASVVEKKGLSVRVVRMRLEELADVAAPYAAVVAVGLIPVSTRGQIAELPERLVGLLADGGLLFVTGFMTDEPGLERRAQRWTPVARNSYLNDDGDTRTFLESGEMRSLFGDFDIVHYYEGMRSEDANGAGATERHAVVEAVFRKTCGGEGER